MLGRECNTTSVAQAFDIWALFPHSTKSIQSLQDLFFHCRWSWAHASLPLAQGSTLLLAQHTPFFHPVCSPPSAHTRLRRDRQRQVSMHEQLRIYGHFQSFFIIVFVCFHYYLQIKALKGLTFEQNVFKLNVACTAKMKIYINI